MNVSNSRQRPWSDWSLEQVGTCHIQTSSSVNNNSDLQLQNSDQWRLNSQGRKRMLPFLEIKQCCTSPLCKGLLMGVLVCAIPFTVFCILWMKSDNKNSAIVQSVSSTLTCMTLLTGTNEIVYGLWNTTAGGSSSLSNPGSNIGNYNPTQTPQNAFDQNSTTKYNSYGICNQSTISLLQCGENTGLYLTLQRGASLLAGIRFCTAISLPERDPMTITVEGSNQSSSALLFGSSWTLMYNGSSGLDSDPGRASLGVTEIISNNVIWYNSYRLLITSKRNMSNAVQYSEVELLGC